MASKNQEYSVWNTANQQLIADLDRVIPDCAEKQRIMENVLERLRTMDEYKVRCEIAEMENKQLKGVFIANHLAVPDPSEKPPKIRLAKTRKVTQFRDLIQGDNVEDLLMRLHKRIDGKIGKAVAKVLLKAKADCIISSLPSEAIFKTAFNDIPRIWRSISKYLDPKLDPKTIDYSSVII